MIQVPANLRKQDFELVRSLSWGVLLTGKQLPSGSLRHFKQPGSSRLVAHDPEHYRYVTATPQTPFVLPEPGLFGRPSLEELAADQIRNGASFVLTPTGHIEEGEYNGTRLDGLNFVMLVQWPGEIADGNGREQFIIDERADVSSCKVAGEIVSHACVRYGHTAELIG